MRVPPEHIVPDWPAPPGVRGIVTTRSGGVGAGAHASFNLGQRAGDDPRAVARNRELARTWLPAEPVWLRQVHGSVVVDAATVPAGEEPQADAAFTRAPRVVCAVLVADCMPVLLAATDGSVVGAAHAGWRGLAGGVIEATLEAMQVRARDVLAFLGPAIGPHAYEVGEEVRDAFVAHGAGAESAFTPTRPRHWLLDLYAIARQRLAAQGVRSVSGGTFCTYSDPGRFFSFRRERTTGRMAAFIWRE